MISFHEYVEKSVAKASVQDLVSPISDRNATALLFCYRFGHPGRPRRFLSRFNNRPWRCARCKTWWTTHNIIAYGGSAWVWEFAGTGLGDCE